MQTLRIATFNLYFFGDRNATGPAPKVVRDAGDLTMLATILADIDADVIAFQEIHDRALLQTVLDEANLARPGRAWRAVAASVKSPRGRYQVVVAVDTARVQVGAASTPIAKVPRSRAPVVVEVDIGGVAVQVVGVHLKSDWPAPTPAAAADDPRREECTRLAAWMDANPRERRVVLGDFNAVTDNAVLAPLVASPGLRHLPHRWPAGAAPWTSATDARFLVPCAIDHVWVAGVGGDVAEVECFDLRDERMRDGAPWPQWLSFDVQDPEGEPRRLQRVSDHRPVWADLAL